MPITIDPSVRRQIREGAATFMVQVLGAPSELAAEALRRARNHVQEIPVDDRTRPNPWPEGIFAARVIPAPEGPFVILHPNFTSQPKRLRFPDTVVAHLKALGVSEARLRELPQRPMDERPKLSEVRPAVTLRLYPAPLNAFRPPRTPVPQVWIEAGLAWLKAEAGDPPPDLWATAFIAEFPIDVASVEAFMLDGRLVRTDTWLRAGRFPQRVSAVWEYGLVPSFILQTGGSDYGTPGVLDAAERLKRLARALAPTVSVAMLSLAERWPALGLTPSASGHIERGYADPGQVAAMCDELLFDAYPYQIIGPGHVEWLGGVPEGAVQVAGRRFELEFGPLEDWLASNETRSQVLARGREVLAGALRSTDEVAQLSRLRWERGR